MGNRDHSEHLKVAVKGYEKAIEQARGSRTRRNTKCEAFIDLQRLAARIWVDMERGILPAKHGITAGGVNQAEIARIVGYFEPPAWFKFDDFQALLEAERLKRDLGYNASLEKTMPGMKKIAGLMSVELIERLTDPEERKKIPASVLFNSMPQWIRLIAEYEGKLGGKDKGMTVNVIRNTLVHLPAERRKSILKQARSLGLLPEELMGKEVDMGKEATEGEVINEIKDD